VVARLPFKRISVGNGEYEKRQSEMYIYFLVSLRELKNAYNWTHETLYGW
jgi:hypothetical protein